MVNCILIDDEPLALQLLEGYIAKIPFMNLLGQFDSPMQAFTVLEKEQVDLIFLDIKMPDITGIDFYRSLTRKPQVIFTTAYSEYAINGFELKAMDYLLKPISFEKFMNACLRVNSFIEQQVKKESPQNDFFFINVSHKMHKVFIDDIVYLEGYKDYTKLHLKSSNNPLLVLHNLKYFEDMLDPQRFVRVHRSYIISLNKVTVASRKAVSIGNIEVPVSDNYREPFMTYITQYLR